MECPLLCAVAASALLISGCDQNAPTGLPNGDQLTRAAATTHETVRQPFFFGGFNPCTQEETPLRGELLFQTNVTEQPAGGFHGEFLFNGKATGTGLTTGAKYRAHEVEHGTLNTNGGQQSTETFIAKIHVTTAGPQNDFYLKTTFHITVNANGEVTVLRDAFRVECR